jgi:putative transposase
VGIRSLSIFNKRKGRKGAYWEDRYHATAIEADKHLYQCLVYIDLNMVRAGVVEHPSEWGFCGYNEILAPRKRYALIDYDGLRSLLNFDSRDDMGAAYRGWIEETLGEGNSLRDGKWTESVAVGSEAFVTATKEALGNKGEGRAVTGGDGSYELRDPPAAYEGIFGHQNGVLKPENEYFWENTD